MSPVDVVKYVLFKEDIEIDSKFSKIIVNKYLSSYDPMLCSIVNSYFNDVRLNEIDDNFYLQFLRKVLPKCPRKFISVEKFQKPDKPSEESKRIAELEEISQKEIDLYLKEFNLNTEKYG